MAKPGALWGWDVPGTLEQQERAGEEGLSQRVPGSRRLTGPRKEGCAEMGELRGQVGENCGQSGGD